MFFNKQNNPNNLKKLLAIEAAKNITSKIILGIGTGSTIKFLIEELINHKNKIKKIVSSSKDTSNKLKILGFNAFNINQITEIDLYIDSADECNNRKELIKGKGGALTQEKICSIIAKKFICIIDESKKVNILGKAPIPIEVIPIACNYVSNQIIKLGGQPIYRKKTITDNGNIILDIYNFKINNAIKLEKKLNQITGVVANGIFAIKSPDIVIVAKNNGHIQKF